MGFVEAIRRCLAADLRRTEAERRRAEKFLRQTSAPVPAPAGQGLTLVQVLCARAR